LYVVQFTASVDEAILKVPEKSTTTTELAAVKVESDEEVEDAVAHNLGRALEEAAGPGDEGASSSAPAAAIKKSKKGKKVRTSHITFMLSNLSKHGYIVCMVVSVWYSPS
jgi:phosphopantothenoylcysteine synthetase/decarboxylase